MIPRPSPTYVIKRNKFRYSVDQTKDSQGTFDTASGFPGPAAETLNSSEINQLAIQLLVTEANAVDENFPGLSGYASVNLTEASTFALRASVVHLHEKTGTLDWGATYWFTASPVDYAIGAVLLSPQQP